MSSDFSPIARAALERILRDMYPNASQIILPAAGGFVVGLCDAAFKDSTPGEDRVLELLTRLGPVNASISDPRDRVVVFTVRLYAAEVDAYNRRAALRIRGNTWDRGAQVTHATSMDAYVLAHEIETEAMLIDPQSRVECRVIPDMTLTPFISEATRFVQFDLEGYSLAIDHLQKLANGIWNVHVT